MNLGPLIPLHWFYAAKIPARQFKGLWQNIMAHYKSWKANNAKVFHECFIHLDFELRPHKIDAKNARKCNQRGRVIFTQMQLKHVFGCTLLSCLFVWVSLSHQQGTDQVNTVQILPISFHEWSFIDSQQSKMRIFTTNPKWMTVIHPYLSFPRFPFFLVFHQEFWLKVS